MLPAVVQCREERSAQCRGVGDIAEFDPDRDGRALGYGGADGRQKFRLASDGSAQKDQFGIENGASRRDRLANGGAERITKPRPEIQLAGLVWSLTPRSDRTHSTTGENAGWYRKPVVLGSGVLGLAAALYVVFW